MGRLRKPVELRLLDGSYSRTRHGPLPEPEETSGPLVKPADLKGPAAKFWTVVAELLAGVVRDRDAPMLAELCRWWARAQIAGRKLDTMSPGTVEYGRLMRQAAEASGAFDRIAKRFGLTPSDRAQLRAEQVVQVQAKVPVKPATVLDKKGKPKK